METPTTIKLEYLEPLGLEHSQLNEETTTTIKLEYVEPHGTENTENTQLDVDNNDCMYT